MMKVRAWDAPRRLTTTPQLTETRIGGVPSSFFGVRRLDRALDRVSTGSGSDRIRCLSLQESLDPVATAPGSDT